MESGRVKSQTIRAVKLRRSAEERLRSKEPLLEPPRTEYELQRIVHELEVHQIELELQNEELNRARTDVEKVLEKYTDLYDFAPVGYTILDHNGTIRNANLTCATFLGVARASLLGQNFGKFLTEQYRSVFSKFLDAVFSSGGKAVCEVALLNKEKLQIILQVEAMVDISNQECRLALIDITGRSRPKMH